MVSGPPVERPPVEEVPVEERLVEDVVSVTVDGAEGIVGVEVPDPV